MAENAHTIDDLHQMQAAPLSVKIRMTQSRIRDWVNEFGEDGVYVSFSGGKDSTVLLHIVREMYPNIPAVFCDTGLEYPEVRAFVKTFDNVTWLKPKMTFRQVIEKYGYPFISKEVAECVWGARKYLTSVIEQMDDPDRQTDRQTNRQTDRQARSGDLSVREDFSAKESTQNRARIWEAVKRAEMSQIGGAAQYKDLVTFSASERLMTALTQDSGKVIDNFRIQRLMGILPMQGKATPETIPSKPNRSMFSCSRYQFFLDATFEIGQQCCHVMKKGPMDKYHRDTGRQPITAMMASESRLRTQKWLHQGCNAFTAKKPMSMPMAFWFEQDVLQYIYQNELPIASVYGDVVVDYEAMGQLDGQMRLDDLSAEFGIFDLERPTYRTTGCDRTG